MLHVLVLNTNAIPKYPVLQQYSSGRKIKESVGFLFFYNLTNTIGLLNFTLDTVQCYCDFQLTFSKKSCFTISSM